MKTIVITIQDDVCARNGRDPEATSLIEKARHYGKVESGESFFATKKAEYETIIRNLNSQIEAINENEITPMELEVLRLLRKKTASEATSYEQAIAERDAQLRAIQVESENRVAQLKAMFGL